MGENHRVWTKPLEIFSSSRHRSSFWGPFPNLSQMHVWWCGTQPAGQNATPGAYMISSPLMSPYPHVILQCITVPLSLYLHRLFCDETCFQETYFSIGVTDKRLQQGEKFGVGSRKMRQNSRRANDATLPSYVALFLYLKNYRFVTKENI